MKSQNIIDELLLEVSLHHPIPDFKNPEHVRTLLRICEEAGHYELLTELENLLLKEKSWRKAKKQAAMAAKKGKPEGEKSPAEKMGLVHLGGPYYGPKEGEPATHMSKEGKIEPMTEKDKAEKAERDSEKAGEKPEEKAPEGEPTPPAEKSPEQEKKEKEFNTAKEDPESILSDPAASAQSQAIARDQAAKNTLAATEKKPDAETGEDKEVSDEEKTSDEKIKDASTEINKMLDTLDKDKEGATPEEREAISSVREKLNLAIKDLQKILSVEKDKKADKEEKSEEEDLESADTEEAQTLSPEEKEEMISKVESEIEDAEPNPDDVATDIDQFQPVKDSDPKGTEVMGKDGKKYYSLGGGYYAETPDGPAVWKVLDEEDEGIDENIIHIVESAIQNDTPDDWYRLFEATTTIKTKKGPKTAVRIGKTKPSQKLAKAATEKAKRKENVKRIKSLSPSKRANLKDLSKDEVKQYIESRIENARKEFESAPNKEGYAIGFLRQRSDEINDNYLRPQGTEASSFAENNGSKLAKNFMKAGGKLTTEEEEKILGEMLSSPLAKTIPPDDRKRWARIALNTARTEANVLLNEPKYRAKKEQRDPYPNGVIVDKQSRQMLVNYFTHLAKEASTPEARSHYERQLRFIKELGESDTGIMYELEDDTVGFKHTSNKSTYADPHNNTSVAEKVNYIKKKMGGTLSPEVEKSFSRITDKVSNASKGLESDCQKFAKERESLSPDERRSQEVTIGNLLQNFPVRGGKRKNYLDFTNKPWFKKKAEEMGIKLPVKSSADIVKVAIVSAGEDEPATDAVKAMRKVSEVLEKVTDDNIQKIAKTFNISANKLKSLSETAATIKDSAKNRRDVMAEAHEELVSSIQKADSKTTPPSYPKDPNADNGPHQQAYVSDYMHRMHFDSYIMGERDGVSSQNIGGDNIEPEYYRQCLAELSGYTGDINEEAGRKDLITHLSKRMRVSPKSDSIIFTNDTGEVEIGNEEYRTKGESKGVMGNLGKGLQQCLKSKVKIGAPKPEKKGKKSKSTNEILQSLSPEIRKKVLERIQAMKILLETTATAGYDADGEPPTGHTPDGQSRKLNSGKPENWFKQLGFSQLEIPKADRMRAKATYPVVKDKETQYRKLSYKVQNVVSSTLNPAEKKEGVDKWKTVKNPAKQVRKAGEVRYWDLEDTEAGKKKKGKRK